MHDLPGAGTKPNTLPNKCQKKVSCVTMVSTISTNHLLKMWLPNSDEDDVLIQ